MRFAEHHEVVKGFSANRFDWPLDVAILPGRPGRGRVVTKNSESGEEDRTPRVRSSS